MELSDIRSQFPHIGTGRIYLNHAATSPWSNYVIGMTERFRYGRSEGDIDIYRESVEVITETRSLAAEMLNTEPGRIGFVQNTSEGLAILASGLSWKSGDRIILVEQEFPANVYPFLNLTRLGVEIDYIPQKNGRISIEDIDRAMTPKTKLVAVSWVQFLSGFKIDLAVLSELCSSKGVLLSVDAIQGLGGIRLNLKDVPLDFMSAGVQKWQMGLQGLGIIYVSEKAQELIQQTHMGWLSVKHAWDFFNYHLDPHDDARRYETGTYNTIGIYGYNGALRFFKEAGFDAVESMVLANSDYLYQKASAQGFHMFTPADPSQRAGIVTIGLPNADIVTTELEKEKISVSARVGYLRMAPHFYNTYDEIDRTLEMIAHVSRNT